MKHEKFKVFKVTGNDISAIDRFFTSSPVTPKSISISHVDNDNSIISIGYEEAESIYEFHLVTRSIKNGVVMPDFTLEAELETIATSINGIICQDIVAHKSDIIVTFLTTK